MIEPEFWDDPKATGLFTNDFNSPVINFSNLNVLTDYFNQEALKAPSGNVRHIILTSRALPPIVPPEAIFLRSRQLPMRTPTTL